MVRSYFTVESSLFWPCFTEPCEYPLVGEERRGDVDRYGELNARARPGTASCDRSAERAAGGERVADSGYEGYFE